MKKSKKWLLGLVLLMLVGISLLALKNTLKAGANAFLYGYPIVLMDETRRAMLADDAVTQNRFVHKTQFPDHKFRSVVRPNVDTLYSIAWLDLSDEPLVLSVPNTHGRYYVVPFMDMWTNVFASVGKRTNGTQAGKFVVLGPNTEQKSFYSTTYENLPVIQSPTNQVWIIARIQTNGADDIGDVAALQKQFSLQPLAQWRMSPYDSSLQISKDIIKQRNGLKSDPAVKVSKLSAIEFLNRLMALIKSQGALEHDQQALLELKNLGFDSLSNQTSYKLGFIREWLLEKSFALTKEKIKQRLGNLKDQENGWVVRRKNIGAYGENYTVRAAVAMIGLGALTPEEAVYPNANVDSQGQPLNGLHEYILHFDENQLPPVDAFWSLTMYDEEGFLIESDIDRYAIGDRDKLVFNDNGSLDIIIQHKRPSRHQSNWLPAPSGRFAVTLRMYQPKSAFLQGQWILPGIQKRQIRNKQ